MLQLLRLTNRGFCQGNDTAEDIETMCLSQNPAENMDYERKVTLPSQKRYLGCGPTTIIILFRMTGTAIQVYPSHIFEAICGGGLMHRFDGGHLQKNSVEYESKSLVAGSFLPAFACRMSDKGSSLSLSMQPHLKPVC